MVFLDRRDAGRALAGKLEAYAGRPDVLVLGLPRGGVPVAFEVAQALGAPLDVFLVRKLGTPGQEELAMGAIASGGVRVLHEQVVRALGIPARVIEQAAVREGAELARREQAYRGSRPPPPVEGRTVLVVDDGLATGSSMRAALAALRRRRPARLVVAVPVAAASTALELASEADEVVTVHAPEAFHAVGEWYEDFSATSDGEVKEILDEAWRLAGPRPS